MKTIQIDKVNMDQLSEALRNELIAKQNDDFRQLTLQCDSIGRWVVTQAVHAEGPVFVAQCIAAVKAYDDFNPDIDPHGDHSMGQFEVEGQKVWFKIDLYDPAYEYGSDEPLEVTKTRRVLTILFPRDY